MVEALRCRQKIRLLRSPMEPLPLRLQGRRSLQCQDWSETWGLGTVEGLLRTYDFSFALSFWLLVFSFPPCAHRLRLTELPLLFRLESHAHAHRQLQNRRRNCVSTKQVGLKMARIWLGFAIVGVCSPLLICNVLPPHELRTVYQAA